MLDRLLWLFLIAGAWASGAGAEPDPIRLFCQGGTKTDASVVATLCATLETELGKRKPERTIHRSMSSESPPKGVWNVVLEVALTEPYHWEGHLTWEKTGQKNSGKLAAGPPVQIYGMDAPLGPGAYSHFIRSLLKVSKPAFLASPRNVNGPFHGVSGSYKN